MSLPLYAQAQEMQNANYPAGGNMGLWYNKFCNRWEIIRDNNINITTWTLDKGKVKWIETAARKCGRNEQLEENLIRYISLMRSCGGDVRVYRTASRFVTGLGNEHPVENGFTWHHTLGTPYLPGSSVKGVLRNWVEQWEELEGKERHDLVDEVFGPDSDKGDKNIGSLICFDALPVRQVELEIEVMTPHYSPYYQDKVTNKPPADWYSPVPIPYLTVAEDQLFIFGLALRSGAPINVDQAFNWLDQALKTTGAGAKTASGYGCFQVAENYELPVIEQQININKAEANTELLSPIRKEMEADGYSNANLELFMGALTNKWLDRMDDKATSGDDRHEIASLLKDWYLAQKAADWEHPKPKSKNLFKVQRIKAALNNNQ